MYEWKWTNHAYIKEKKQYQTTATILSVTASKIKSKGEIIERLRLFAIL